MENCISDNAITETPKEIVGGTEKNYSIKVTFEYGEDGPSSNYKNIYVVWMENKQANFIQNMRICQKLVTGGLTNTALPFWKMNTYPSSSKSEIDAVTSATVPNKNFAVAAFLKDTAIREFDLFFEIDRSFESNDWFSDQPALLYSTTINLDDLQNEYELQPLGWTPNEGTQNKIPNTPAGQLQKEMRFITHHKDGEGFGEPDERASTKMVKSITAKIIPPLTTSAIQLKNDASFSVYPNPSSGELHIKSKRPIQKLTIENIQGQSFLHKQPENTEVGLWLDKSKFPGGTYIITVIEANGSFSQQMLLIE